MSKIKIHMSYYPRGSRYFKRMFQNKILHGTSTWWHEDGELWHIIKFKNGDYHGLAQWWWKNGTLMQEATYENNLIHGISKRWHKSGRPYDEDYYLYGIQVSKKKYREHILIESLACLK